MLWLAREAHGRVPASAGFALPLAYALPFQLGFVNFTLAAALAMAGLALWIRLARTQPDWVRIVAFVPIAGLVWVCHSFGWAMLGLFVLGAEWVIRGRRGEAGWRRIVFAALACAPMAWPQLLAMTGGVADGGGHRRLVRPGGQGAMDRLAAARTVEGLRCRVRHRAGAGAVDRDPVAPDAVRAVARRAGACSGWSRSSCRRACSREASYVDMRMLPYAVALALLAIRRRWRRSRGGSRLLGAAFFGLRIATSTIAFALFAQGQAERTRGGAAHSARRGGAVAGRRAVDRRLGQSATGPYCRDRGGAVACFHQRAMGDFGGQQLIAPRHPRAAPFDRDPSQLVYPPSEALCADRFRRGDRGVRSRNVRLCLDDRLPARPRKSARPDARLVERTLGALPRDALVAAAPGPLRTARWRTLARPTSQWWQTRRFVVAMALLAMVPLLWPDIPPLVDLPGHMGRYRVQLDLHTYPLADRLVRFPLAADRQSRDRHPRPDFRADPGARTHRQADRAVDPAADRRRLAVDRARGAWAHPRDRLVRAAARLLLPAAVRLRQFHAVDGARAADVRAVAADRAARQVPAARDPVRAAVVRVVGLPHVRLGRARRARLLGRNGPRARSRQADQRASLQPGHRRRASSAGRWRGCAAGCTACRSRCRCC